MTPGVGDDAAPTASFTEVLASRRMCRDFAPDQVQDVLLDRVLHAAFRGPSAGNTDGLELLVLTGGDRDAYWALTLPPERRGEFPWPGLLHAPVLVVPYVDPTAYPRRYGRADKAGTGLGSSTDAWPVPYWWVDGGAAVMAMLLAAESEGLGALFFGQFSHEPAVARLFGVGEHWRAAGTVALGHAAPGGRRPSASAVEGRPGPAGRIHRGSW